MALMHVGTGSTVFLSVQEAQWQTGGSPADKHDGQHAAEGWRGPAEWGADWALAGTTERLWPIPSLKVPIKCSTLKYPADGEPAGVGADGTEHLQHSFPWGDQTGERQLRRERTASRQTQVSFGKRATPSGLSLKYFSTLYEKVHLFTERFFLFVCFLGCALVSPDSATSPCWSESPAVWRPCTPRRWHRERSTAGWPRRSAASGRPSRSSAGMWLSSQGVW